MRLFGTDPARPSAATPAHGQPADARPAGVEVSELELDEEAFASTFGLGSSQFAALDEAADRDPWSAMLRLD